MDAVTIPKIEEQLAQLSPKRLQVVYDFVSYLIEREHRQFDVLIESDASQTMLTSEAVLQRDRDTFEEDAAWAHL